MQLPRWPMPATANDKIGTAGSAVADHRIEAMTSAGIVVAESPATRGEPVRSKSRRANRAMGLTMTAGFEAPSYPIFGSGRFSDLRPGSHATARVFR